MEERKDMAGMVSARASTVLFAMSEGESLDAALDEEIRWWAEMPGAAQVPRDRVAQRVREEIARALDRSERQPSDRPERDLEELDAKSRERILKRAIRRICGPDPVIGRSSRPVPVCLPSSPTPGSSPR